MKLTFWSVTVRTLLLLAFCPTLSAETRVEVSSLAELRDAMQKSEQLIVMRAGRYTLTDLPEDSRRLEISGSNNTIDLSNVYVAVPVGSTRRSYIRISGDNNVFRGGTFEDVYLSGLKEVTDFSAYNQNRSTLARGLDGSAVLYVSGDDNTVADTKLTVRGSYPYGYGSMYGIGADSVYGLDKRCGILLRGKRNTVDGCEVQQRAFGHGIYMQSPADESLIKNCLVEGIMRPSQDLYLETDPADLPARSNYKMPILKKPTRRRRSRRSRSSQEAEGDRGTAVQRDERNRREDEDRNDAQGPPIPKDIMIPLCEDGIRVYTGGGSVTVEDCTVKKMRGGIRLYLASHATVTNCTAIDCGHTNFNLPKGGKVRGSSGNFTYGPLSDFRLSKSRQDLELTILPSSDAIGPHNVADVLGDDHNIVFHRTSGPLDTSLRPIVVSGKRSTIRNETEYPITLESTASENTIISFGPVTDLGSNNIVRRIERLR